MEQQHNDHDLLIRIDTKLDSYIQSSNVILTDHEARLRIVERIVQRVKGIQWLIAIGVPVATAIITTLLTIFL